MKPGGRAHPGRGARAAARPKRATPAPPAVPPLPLAHPATILVALVAAAGIVASVSFRIIDTDFWQHQLVGKAIWTLHHVPLQHLWTWPNYGTPEVSWAGRSGWSPSWGFRALIWPVWSAGGVTGLFVWRWATTLAVFGLAWAAARRMGARGLAPLVVLVWCSLLYRHRSQIRPETLASVWLALELLLLEWRRAAPRAPGVDRAWALVPVACAWANTHISAFLFFLVLGVHLLVETWRTRALPRTLGLVFVASLAAAMLNPFGWPAVWAPFAYFIQLRNDPMLRHIGELQPLSWSNNRTDGVFVMLALWPLLILWRWRREGLDTVEALLCAFFTWTMVQSERFFGPYAVVAAVYLSRDVDTFVRSRRWPRWTAAASARAALASVAILAVGAAEWARADRPLSISIDMHRFPVGAMDFIERHGVGGHGFSQLRIAGYQLWRFWPDRDRLPFMDIHATASAEDRAGYARALSRRDGWRTLDRGGRFDYVVLDPTAADSLLEALDADPALALVFLDDTGVLYARRGGRNGAIADSFGYRYLGAGADKLARSFAEVAASADPKAHAALLAELDRLARSSPRNARANSMRATLAIAEKRLPDARAALEAALRADPRTPLAHFRLAGLALFENRPQDAIAEYERERRIAPRPGLDLGIGMAYRLAGNTEIAPRPGLDLGIGMAYRLAGNTVEARRHFQLETLGWPGTLPARAAAQALDELK